MRRRLGGMWIVPCDFAFDVRTDIAPGMGGSTIRVAPPRPCQEEFRSASIAEVIPAQLKFAGWKSRATSHGVQWFCKHHAARIGKLAATANAEAQP